MTMSKAYLDARRCTALVAAGESQSAARMVTYVNAIHPIANVFDGFLIHSRSNGGAPLQAGSALPQPTRIRDDLTVPVFQFETETDLLGLSFIDARQPDTPRLRTWEVPGTAHLDRYLIDYLRSERSPTEASGAPPSTPDSAADPITAQCGPVNEGPQSAVLSKAVASLRDWVVAGTAPASSPPIEVRDGTIARDGLGLALGGVRTPAVDAPLAELRGDNLTATSYTCSLFGSTKAFDQATLERLYPDRAAYVDAVRRSADEGVAAGHLLRADADRFVDAAQRYTPSRAAS